MDSFEKWVVGLSEEVREKVLMNVDNDIKENGDKIAACLQQKSSEERMEYLLSHLWLMDEEIGIQAG